MKKLSFIVMALFVTTFFSCSNNDETIPVEQTTQTSARYISIYADKDCKQPLVVNYPLIGNDNTANFELQYGLDQVYVKTVTADGVKVEAYPVEECSEDSRTLDPGTYEYFKTMQGVRYVSLKYHGEATPGYITSDGEMTCYHCSGVVMFEDTWPSKSNVDGLNSIGGLFFSDYNDLVVDYDLESAETTNESMKYKEGLKVVLHIRARGGECSDRFGLKLLGLNKKMVNETPTIYYSMSNHESPKDRLKAEVVWDGDNPIIYINDLSKLLDQTFMNNNGLNVSIYNNRPYYNTVNDGSNVGKGLFTFTVFFSGKQNSNAVNKMFRKVAMNSKNQDFFIVTTHKTKVYETHLAGYNPTGFYTTYDADKDDLADGVKVDKDNNVTYQSADGYVWGFKVPVLTKHTTERSNFGVSYPKFEKWVKTGKRIYSKWYLDGSYEMNGQFLIMPW